MEQFAKTKHKQGFIARLKAITGIAIEGLY